MLTAASSTATPTSSTVKLFAHAEREDAYARDSHGGASWARAGAAAHGHTLMELVLYALNGAAARVR